MLKILKYLVLMAAALCLLTVVINTSPFDQSLRPEVQAIKDLKAQPYSALNAYPALLAINSTRADFVEYTESIRTFLNQKIKQSGDDYLNGDEFDQFVNIEADQAWQSEYPRCNSRRERGCMAHLFDAVVAQPINQARLLSQLEKYAALIQLTEYSDPTQMDLAAPFVPFGPVLALKRLYLANSHATQGADGFMAAFKQDMTFWRMLLQEGHHMITKMVAVASINNGIGALSKALDEDRFDSSQLRQLLAMVPRLTQAETNMRTVFQHEFKHGIDLFDQAEQTGELQYLGWFDLFQPNATHNLAYELSTRPLLAMSALSAQEFHQQHSRGAWDLTTDDAFSWSPTTLYNPTGKMLLSIATPAYADYVARVHDLDGMLALLRLKIEIKLNPETDVAAVIASSQERNPYTQQPMGHDAAGKRIHFACADGTSDVCELSL
ncbi:hypothetical protein [Marinicella meishanensis]|uniref:hypothetical protein n=1 Tax=Marinicella meishanensis TaxID=2873263 RepID=UPI001CBCB5BC|nr:hypothetical protein [Marinicella sp. NBU2979]